MFVVVVMFCLDYDELSRNVGRLYFAGEATNKEHPATVPGALLSGLRAAGEIDSLDRRIDDSHKISLDARPQQAQKSRAALDFKAKQLAAAAAGSASAVVKKGVRAPVFIRIDPVAQKLAAERLAEIEREAKLAAAREEKRAAETKKRVDSEFAQLMDTGFDPSCGIGKYVRVRFVLAVSCCVLC